MTVYEGKYEAFALDELAPEVQDIVVQGWLNEELMLGDLFWSEHPIEEIQDAGEALGISISRNRNGGTVCFDMDHNRIAWDGGYEFNANWRKDVAQLGWGGEDPKALDAIGEQMERAGSLGRAAMKIDSYNDTMVIEVAEPEENEEVNVGLLENALWEFVQFAFNRLRINWDWQCSEARARQTFTDMGYEFDRKGGLVAIEGELMVEPRRFRTGS